ncbi:YpmS family protein [Sporosarcina sp. YIM B06819]|uniref:YpmS family protein n=1 Tax=Sporosarcina sp. YIM B06819 TaxID=3081769 RepID=UPI00298D4D30|nr:YpmS family protein [Sporosarcina sp. YIM B06819]
MNKWKIGFFLLAGLVAAAISAVIVFISSTTESVPLPDMNTRNMSDNVLTVKATKENLEGIANTFIRKAMKEGPLPVTMKISDEVLLFSEMTMFSLTFPVIMHFDPVVQQDGNLILKLSKMEIGELTVMPSIILKILKDSVKLPDWMTVRPKEEEIFFNLSEIPVTGNLQVRAKTFNLAEDDIILELIIPQK